MTVNELIAHLNVFVQDGHGDSLIYVDARMTEFPGSHEVPFRRVGVELNDSGTDEDGSPALYGMVTLTD